MAPKIWSKLFSKQTTSETKLSINSSINESFDSTKNDFLFNEKVDENKVHKNFNEIKNNLLINNNSNEENNQNSQIKQSINEEIDRKLIETKRMSTHSVSSSTTTSSSTSSKSKLSTKTTNSLKTVTNNENNEWPKVGVLLFNNFGQCGYQYLPTIIQQKLFPIISSKSVHNNSNNSNNNNNSFETIICEMIFGSVALNFCAKNSSKMHKLSDDLFMTSFIFNIDYSNGKTCQKKYGLAVIWDINECNGQLKQLILKETIIIDSLMTELKNDLITSRLKTPKDIHKSVTKFIKTINDYLSVCRLTTNISEDQFIDELSTLISNYDTKATNFFVSTLMTSILMFKFKSKKMKLILWSNDVNKISLISQLLVVINQFLTYKVKMNNYLIPQLKSIKFCRDLTLIKRTSSVTGVTKSIISERKSRDESLGYESLTESSGSTSTVCEYSNGFSAKLLITSTPLTQSLEQSVEENGSQVIDDFNNEENSETQNSSQLNKSRNYFREYRNLRFTSNSTTDGCIDEEFDTRPVSPITITENSCLAEHFVENKTKDLSVLSNDDHIESVTTADVEEVHDSKLLSGFGECSMPELISDLNETSNQISLSQSPTITDTYLSQMSIQGIVNSKTVKSYEQLLSDCMKQSSIDSNEDTIIVIDCDLWRINCVESSRCLPPIMSSSVGNLCENITEFYSLKMNTKFILNYIENKLNELTLKANVLKSLIENSCYNNKESAVKLFDRDLCQSILALNSDNYLSDFSSIDCLNLGFDVSDIPVIIGLNRHSIINNNRKCFDRNETHFVETKL